MPGMNLLSVSSTILKVAHRSSTAIWSYNSFKLHLLHSEYLKPVSWPVQRLPVLNLVPGLVKAIKVVLPRAGNRHFLLWVLEGSEGRV